MTDHFIFSTLVDHVAQTSHEEHAITSWFPSFGLRPDHTTDQGQRTGCHSDSNTHRSMRSVLVTRDKNQMLDDCVSQYEGKNPGEGSSVK